MGAMQQLQVFIAFTLHICVMTRPRCLFQGILALFCVTVHPLNATRWINSCNAATNYVQHTRNVLLVVICCGR